MISVIIAGAGSGKRFGNRPKAFFRLGGRELIYYSVENFCPVADEIVAVLPAGCEKEWEAKLGIACPGIRVAAGGSHRQDSVSNGLEMLSDGEGIVLVHDVARPFLSSALLERIISAAEKYGACVPCTALSDTVKEAEGPFVGRTLDRSRLFQVQTPQAFRKDILRNAYRQACVSGFYGSDDSILVERTDTRVYLVEGERENIKITYPDDLQLANIILEKWKKAE